MKTFNAKDVLERLKIALNLESNADISRILEVSPGTISNWIKRNTLDFQLVFSKCEQTNIDWLLTGRGYMLYESPTTIACEPQTVAGSLTTTYKKVPEKNIGIQQIPLYDVTAAAGIAQLFQSTHGHIPSDYISIPHAPRCDGAIYIKGDSMYPLLKSGDIVLYKEIRDVQNSICWGEMYIISYDNDGDDYVVIKYIHPGNDKDHVLLVSQNPHHASQEIPIAWIRALALVKVSIRFNTMG